ncbi:MAG: DUF4332 domain-containing protein [Armatimonadota bacterium]|jgi:predicted flap endonuclease-1-like 5' DNA nuclease|nr:DUF4332 domain-containing protein [Armatimonadota bacterium]
MAMLTEIEGVGEAYAAALAAVGVKSVEALLQAAATAKGRQELAEKTGISEKLILRWVNHADLFRIKGVGSEYAELLEAAGVDSVPELAQRNPANLLEALTRCNAERQRVRRLPTLSEVEAWVAEAKTLPRVVMH